jgi:hypothetical protein
MPLQIGISVLFSNKNKAMIKLKGEHDMHVAPLQNVT